MFETPYPPFMGADPEVFVVKKSSPKIGIPSEMFLPKGQELFHDPWIFHDEVKVDNGALEINPIPSGCLQLLNENIGECLNSIQPLLTIPKLCLSPRTVMKFKKDDIFNWTSLTTFGCAPSKLCKEGIVTSSVPLVDPFAELNRSAGYHIHVGKYKNDLYSRRDYRTDKTSRFLSKPTTNVKIVQHCDLFAGLVGVLIDPDPVNIWRRKVMGYGCAGEFRDQPHGFEYRVLPNFPLRHPILAWIMHCLVRDAYYASMMDLRLYDHINMADVATVINSNDRLAAAAIWLELKHVLKKKWFDEPSIQRHSLLRSSTIMFQIPMIQKLEFFITHFPLESTFRTIDLKSWNSDTTMQGLNEFLSEKTRGRYSYASGRRLETVKTKKMYANFETFNTEWDLLFDASLIRHF